MGRQVGFDAGGEIREHILARRLIIDQHDAAEATADLFRYTGAFGRAAHDESMVEAGEDLFVHNPFQALRNPSPCRTWDSTRRRKASP